MRRRWLFGALAALSLASVLWARQGAVHLNDGSQIVGDVDESDPDRVVVINHGVREFFARTDITSIEYLDKLDEQFDTKLGALNAHDVAGRLDLARWVDGLGRHDLARRAAADALSIDPTNPQAMNLLKLVNDEAALARTTAHAPEPPVTRPAADANPPATPVAPMPGPYLTMDQVNQIRQLELKPDDAFKVTFQNDVRKRYLARGEIDAISFFQLLEPEQARRILATGDADLARDVRIDSDPAAMYEFRQKILPIVLGGCAVSGCHNTIAASGGFSLFTGDVSPRAEYTDFYILQHYERKPAVRDGVVRVMIDRTHPEQSLLAEYSLPREMAAPPHPKADNFRPVYTGRNDPRYDNLLRWISLLLKPEGGMYPDIHYPTTQP
jgi:hypothetical protein